MPWRDWPNANRPDSNNPFFSVVAVRDMVEKISENGRSSVAISVIQQAKVQAQVLVPLVKALQAELGEERANDLVRKALGDTYRRFGEEFWRAKNESNLGQALTSAFATYAHDDALDYRVIAQSQDT